MTKRNSLWPIAALAQICFAPMTYAQLMEDIDIRRDGNHAVVNIRFVTPVQFQRAVTSRSGDLVQVFYTLLPTSETLNLMTGERRLAGGGGLPQLIVTDETAGRETGSSRKLLIRVSTPTRLRVRAGRDKQSIEVVMEGLGTTIGTPASPSPTPTATGRYAITLQSSTDPGTPLKASVPAQFQDSMVFTSRRVVEGQTVYDTNLGYFGSLPEVEQARALLLKRFPDAVIVTLQAQPSAPPAPAERPADAPLTAQPTMDAPDLDARAAALLNDALAFYDRGDYAGTIETLNTLLNLPPNASSRKAQALIGQARLKHGDMARARSELELFLKLYPVGPDSDQIRQLLPGLPQPETAPTRARGPIEPTTTTSGSVSMFYFGGQSQVRTVDFQNSPISGLPTLPSENMLSTTDQKQLQTNVDLNWRHRDAEKDMRFVVRDTYTNDLLPDRPNKNRLSALYFEQRSFLNGTSVRLGRQSPSGGGVLYRFDGIQAGYTFAPKWKVNAVYGIPSDDLLDTRRNFYGLSLDAEALTRELSGSVYAIQQTIDGEIDRRGLGTELRYFNGGVSLSGQLDYDQVLRGMNVIAVQGTWQLPDTTVYNFMYDRRATPIRSLGNILFFQDPALPSPARRIADLLLTTPLDVLRDQVNSITPFQTQAMLGFTTPIAENWQTGADLRYTNVDAIQPVAVILPNGQPSTGNLWSVGWQLIGTNLFSARDTHVFNVSLLSGPTYNGTLLAYNNLNSLNAKWQLEPSLKYYSQTDNTDTRSVRWTPGMRVAYRIHKQISIESELAYELSDTNGPTRTENAKRLFYYLGGRYDF